jgi:hypothetical protein
MARETVRRIQILLERGVIVGKHTIQQRSWTRSAVMTGAVTAAAMCVALSAAGTAEAKTHHGPNAPGNPFSTPSAPLGVGPMQLSATTITRHSTTTTTQFGSARSSTGGGTGTSSSGLGPVSSFNIGTRNTAAGTGTSGASGRSFGPAVSESTPAGNVIGPSILTEPTGNAPGPVGEFGSAGGEFGSGSQSGLGSVTGPAGEFGSAGGEFGSAGSEFGSAGSESGLGSESGFGNSSRGGVGH